MPASGFCLPGVQMNVALIRCLMSAKHRKNINYISEQPTNLNHPSISLANINFRRKTKKRITALPRF